MVAHQTFQFLSVSVFPDVVNRACQRLIDRISQLSLLPGHFGTKISQKNFLRHVGKACTDHMAQDSIVIPTMQVFQCLLNIPHPDPLPLECIITVFYFLCQNRTK